MAASRLPPPAPRLRAVDQPAPSGPLFVLVAGESSGDLLGANLIADLRMRLPDARFAGIGGPLMRAAGMETWYRADELAVMGLVEVLRHLPRLLAIRRDVGQRTLRAAPTAFIGIDAPDFNLGLERKLRQAGVRTIHYVSPAVWAWRERRAAKIGRSAEQVLCLFPMEPAIYARHGVDARFVGHPLAGVFPPEPDKAAARKLLDLPQDAPVLALLPGSRLNEIASLGCDFVDAARTLAAEFPGLRIVAPMANRACRAAFGQILASRFQPGPSNVAPVLLLDQDSTAAGANQRFSVSQLAMIAADAVLLASGTAALEAMLAKRAMVVAYRVAPLTYWLVKRLGLLRTQVYSLPNILAGRAIVPELMQEDCTPQALAAVLAPALRTRSLDAGTHEEFSRLHAALRADPGSSAGAVIARSISAR